MCSVLIFGNDWCCTSNNNLNGTSHKQTPPQNDFYPSSQTLPSPFSSSRFYCRAVLFRPNLIDSHMPFCKLVAVIYIKRITLFTLTSANGRRRHRRMWEVVMWSRYKEIVVKIGKIVMLNKQTSKQLNGLVWLVSSTYRFCIVIKWLSYWNKNTRTFYATHIKITLRAQNIQSLICHCIRYVYFVLIIY